MSGVTSLIPTPETPAARAGNIVFLAEDPRAVEAALRDQGVLCWAGDGRVRLSVHLYNDGSDVQRALDGLARRDPALIRAGVGT